MSLILTRKNNQSINIGPDIVVRVCSMQGGSVRLAVEAPPTVKILRTELTNRDTGSKSGPLNANASGAPEEQY
jgi:carbon storage regulator CsrA